MRKILILLIALSGFAIAQRIFDGKIIYWEQPKAIGSVLACTNEFGVSVRPNPDMMLSCNAVLTIPVQKLWSGERWFSISGLQGEIVAERVNGTRGTERVVSKLELVEKMPGIVMQGNKDLKIRVKSNDGFLIPAKWDGSNFSKVIWGAYITVCTPPKKQEIACHEFSVWSQ